MPKSFLKQFFINKIEWDYASCTYYFSILPAWTSNWKYQILEKKTQSIKRKQKYRDGPRQDLASKFKKKNFHFKFLELINFIYCIFNVSSQFESQKLCYKQDTKFEFFFVMLTQFESCYCLRMWSIDIRFVQMFLSSVDYIIYEHIELYATSYLVKKMVISYCTFVNLYQKFKLHK